MSLDDGGGYSLPKRPAWEPESHMLLPAGALAICISRGWNLQLAHPLLPNLRTGSATLESTRHTLVEFVFSLYFFL